MSDLTLKEVLLADMYEKEIEQIKEKQKEFIEWLEKYGRNYQNQGIIDKAKELLNV